jgi:hypothetical protein
MLCHKLSKYILILFFLQIYLVIKACLSMDNLMQTKFSSFNINFMILCHVENVSNHQIEKCQIPRSGWPWKLLPVSFESITRQPLWIKESIQDLNFKLGIQTM